VVQSVDALRERRATLGQGATVSMPVHDDGPRPRVPPHNLEAEEALLGAMMLSRDAIAEALEIGLRPDDFYKPAHGHVYDAISSLYARGEEVDPVTVADVMRRSETLDSMGGRQALLRIQGATPASTNAGRYARIVEELALLRRLIGVAGEIAEMGYTPSDDVSGTIDRAETLVFEVAERRVSDSLMVLYDALEAGLNQLEAIQGRDQRLTGVSTGFRDLDELMLGFQPSALYVLAARPGQGKTSLALTCAAHVAVESRKPVVFFSLEMSHLELTQRLLSAEARVDSRALRTGNLQEAQWPKITQAVGRLAEAPFYIDDNPQTTIMEMRAKCRRIKQRKGDLGLVLVDYLQLMSTPGRRENRQVEVSELSRGLKVLARDLNCPVMALSQLNRSLEYRADKRPMLADLRESGAIEQDADAVMFIYREEAYEPDAANKGLAELIVAKHRAGPTGVVHLAFFDKYTRFHDAASEG
jgi:replicative DNA helicase